MRVVITISLPGRYKKIKGEKMFCVSNYHLRHINSKYMTFYNYQMSGTDW